MNLRLLLCFIPLAFLIVSLVAREESPAPEVPYPEGYRSWQHICSAILPLKQSPSNTPPTGSETPAAPQGLIHHVYANPAAVDGYRTGHFPEGAVLVADWFVLEQEGPQLVQGPRKSLNVMVRDARHAATGGWGFEDFDRDSRSVLNVGARAATMCFECHTRAKAREHVFSELKP